MTERYMGPSAKRIADLLRHRVSFERGWFLDDDGYLSRRQVGRAGVQAATGRQTASRCKCHTGGCSAGAVITELEALIGLPIWTAYEPVRDAASQGHFSRKWPWWKRDSGSGRRRWSPWVVAAPLITGDVDLFVLKPRRAGHRGTAAPAVHASASGREGPSPLTTGPPAPPYPSQHARVVSIRGRPFS